MKCYAVNHNMCVKEQNKFSKHAERLRFSIKKIISR